MPRGGVNRCIWKKKLKRNFIAVKLVLSCGSGTTHAGSGAMTPPPPPRHRGDSVSRLYEALNLRDWFPIQLQETLFICYNQGVMGLSNIKPFPYSLPLLNLIPFTIGRSEKLRSQGSTTLGHNAFDNLVSASKRSSNIVPSLLPAADAVASPSLSSTTSPMAQPTRRSTHCGDGGPGQQRYRQGPAPRRVRA